MSRIHYALAIVAAVLGLAAGAADGRSTVDVTQLAAEIDAERDHIEAPELAERIMRQDPSLRVIDLRTRAEFDALHIPTATMATLDELARATFPPDASIVVYSEGGTHSAQAWMLLRLRGHRDVRFLREGIYEWLSRVMEPRLAADATPAERADFARAETQSRFFGGLPRSSVPRADVPTGYWTDELGAGQMAERAPAASTQQAVARIRRRGC